MSGQVVGVAHTFVEVWENVSALLAELDVLLGFAELAVNAPTPYVRPTMLPTDAGEIVLTGALSTGALLSASWTSGFRPCEGGREHEHDPCCQGHGMQATGVHHGYANRAGRSSKRKLC